MTPDRRLDQLEPLMADSLQKIDRLIEGQGQLLDVATRADQKADTTAKGLANLTISFAELKQEMRDGFDGVNQKFDGIDQKFDRIDQKFDGIDQKFDGVNQKFDRIDEKFDGVNQKFEQLDEKFDVEIGSLRQGLQQVNQKIDAEVGSLRQEMNQRFDQLITLIQDRLK